MVAAQVIGNDAAIASLAHRRFHLLVMLPVMARNILESINIIGNEVRGFRRAHR